MIILHGDNQVESRKVWIEAKKNKQVLEFDGAVLTVADLANAINTVSLFEQSNSIFIEGLFGRRVSTERKDLISYLEKHPDADITIWEGKDISTQVKDLPNRNLELPKYIFKFLDSPTIEGLHLVLQTMPVEQILASLATRAHKQLKLDWIKSLLTIDYAQKTSQAPYDLVAALELWIAKT